MSVSSTSKKERQGFITYRQLFEDSPAPKYIYDLETYEFLEVNRAALDQYGYTREEFLSLKATDIRPAEELPAFLEVFDDIETTPYYDFGAWKHKRKNGEVFWAHIYAHGTLFENRRARMVLAIDIDKKLTAEKALQEKSADIANILESITDGFFAVNKHWEMIYMNHAAEQVLHCERKDLLGKGLWDYFSAAVGSRSYIEYHHVMNDRVSSHFEDYYEPLDLWVSIRAYPTTEGVAIYFMDITEQKKMLEKQAQDERNLRAIINNTQDTIWSLDHDYNIIIANEPFYRLMEELTGNRITRIQSSHFTKNSFRIWNEHYQRALKGESFKVTWHDKIGRRDIYQEVSFNPITDENGTVSGVNCISRDITGQYTYTKKIEAQNETLRKIAWIQSHEIRAPLSNILGLVALTKQGFATEVQAQEVTAMLEKAAKQLDKVIQQVMSEAKG
ncbi:PAS domain S-box protein [Sediminibacterium soli]|uniref:PAS domain S-box protein n=1 Tax=Sediminibacterium soli TaxID=2698829 RepID=UPI00137A20DA|nr:PAS domain S-box protein [Sediminibacterium soli]NCI45097.1 PAS domain S-box protein [Sediminibacterium soli]